LAVAVKPSADPLPRIAGAVALRRLHASDLSRFHAYRSDPLVGRYQGWTPMTEPEALAFINGAGAAELFVPGEWVQIAIAEASTGQLVGDIGIFVAEGAKSAEVGFTLSPAATGKGYATAAVRETIHLLFAHTPVERVLAVTDALNTRSVRVLERAGMTRIDSRETLFRGEPCTEWVYAAQR
jgi:aminoglycoside 6'-N-acetyltransferase